MLEAVVHVRLTVRVYRGARAVLYRTCVTEHHVILISLGSWFLPICFLLPLNGNILSDTIVIVVVVVFIIIIFLFPLCFSCAPVGILLVLLFTSMLRCSSYISSCLLS